MHGVKSAAHLLQKCNFNNRKLRCCTHYLAQVIFICADWPFICPASNALRRSFMFNLYVSVVVNRKILTKRASEYCFWYSVNSTQVCTVNKQVIEMDIMLSRTVEPLSVYLNWSEIDPTNPDRVKVSLCFCVACRQRDRVPYTDGLLRTVLWLSVQVPGFRSQRVTRGNIQYLYLQPVAFCLIRKCLVSKKHTLDIACRKKPIRAYATSK